MNGKGLELKVGIFIFMAFIILFIIVFSIGDFYMFEKGYMIKVVFGFANGIAETAPVRFAGVDVGELKNIEIFYDEAEKKTKVALCALIGKDVKIEKNAVARINTLGLLGEKYLEIAPGNVEAGFLAEGDTLIGEDPIAVETLTKDMKKLVDSTNAIAEGLKEGKGTVGKLLVEEKIYNDLEAFVADIKAHPWKLLHKGKEEAKPKEQEKKGFSINR